MNSLNLPSVVPLSRRKRLLKWEHLGLLAIVLVTLVLHFMAITRPPTIIWDEKWYVGDARSIVSGTGELRSEHPPLGKLFIAAGELIFNEFEIPEEDTGSQTRQTLRSSSGATLLDLSDVSSLEVGDTIRIGAEQMNITFIDPVINRLTVERGAGGTIVAFHENSQPVYVYTDHAFGWRFFSIVFGTAGIIIFYFICRRLRLPQRAVLLATFLFAAENMTFLHSGLALLDVFMVTFLLAAVLAYLDERYLLAGLFAALSANCKLVGAFILIALALHWIIYRRTHWLKFIAMFLFSAVAFVFFLVFFDIFIKGYIENPIVRIDELLSGSIANTFTDPKLGISSRPWEWLLPQWVNPQEHAPFIVYSFNPQYISFISSTLQIMILPAMAYMFYKAAKGSRAAGLAFLWFMGTYLVWIPIELITNRVTFVFYFLPTIPAVSLAVGMAISNALEVLNNRRLVLDRTTPKMRLAYGAIVFYLVIHLAIFIVFNPAIPPIIKTWLPPFVTN